MGSQADVQPMQARRAWARRRPTSATSAGTSRRSQIERGHVRAGRAAHSWQAVACAGSSIGIKGMLVAAKTMALTLADLYGDPALLATAKEEFLRRRGGSGFKYTTFAPSRPPLDYRK